MTCPQRALRFLAATALLLATALAQAPIAEASSGTCTTTSAGSNTVQVCLSAPAAGSTLTGPTTVTATTAVTAGAATVVSVTFLLDGSGLLTDPEPPFTFTWHTAHWVDGAHTLGVFALMSDGSDSSAHPTTESLTLANGVTSPPVNSNPPTINTGTTPTAGQPKIVAAVGDGAGGDTSATSVANEVAGMSPNLFLYLGDVYEQGSYEEFQDWYDPIYGSLKGVTSPAPGNHEWADYGVGVNAGYEWYWNNLPTYYSFDTNGWHFISLNGNVSNVEQQTWLANDLASHQGACIIAYWHQPLYALSGSGDPSQQGLWAALANAHATLVLNGHVHNYERWTPMDASGNPSTTGTAEIIAGTGGHHTDQVTSSDSRVVTSLGGEFGALKLSLTPTTIGFQFVKTDGTSFDSGSLPCQGSGTVTGSVTDVAAGHGIAGATVAFAGSGPAGPVSGSTTTNASGQYALTGVPATTLTVTAAATGYPTQRATAVVGGNSTTTQNFIYPPPVSGTVADAATNQPISNAPVSYSLGATATDGSGNFTLAGATPGTYTVTASPPGYVSQSQSVTVTSGASTVVHFLCSLARGSVTGTVTDAAITTNLSGATVSFSGGSATTNGAGQYSLSNVVPGTYTLTTSAAGYVNQSQVVTVNAGSTATLNFALNPAGAAAPVFSDGFENGSFSNWTGSTGFTVQTGTVHAGVDAAEGKTSNGQTHAYRIFGSSYTSAYYRVYFDIKSQSSAFTLFGVQAAGVSSIARLYVQSSGQLMLVNDVGGMSWIGPLLSRGTWHAAELHVVINGSSSTTEAWLDGTYLSAFNQTTNLGTSPVNEIRMGELNSGLSYDVVYDDVVLSTTRVGLSPTVISGTVTDATSGQPISGATISYPGGSTSTAANGTYSLTSVAPGTYAVSAAAPGHTSQSANVSVAAGNTATANFALTVAPGALAGTVTDANTHQPLAGAQVVYSSATASGSTNTNGSGQYSLTGVPAGTYTVTVSATGYTTQSQTEVVTAGTTTTQNFALSPANGSVSGQVTDALTGQPVGGASVSTSAANTTTSATGQYLLSMPAGSYTLTVSASGYAGQSQALAVAAGATVSRNVALAPNPGSIAGTVTDGVTNAALSGATVSSSAGSTSTDAQGHYSLTGVAEGSYMVTVSLANYTGQTQTVAVGPGAGVTQNFALAPTPGSIAGTVTDASTGQPIGGATVSLAGASATTNAQGSYTLTNVTEGTYTVSAAAANYATQSATVGVGAGGSVTQNFALTPHPATVSGTVTDAVTGQPVSGATVSAPGGSTTTNGQGSYSLNNVPAGTVTVSVTAAGYAGASATLTVGPGGTATQNFALAPNPGTISGTVIDASTRQPISGATVTAGAASATTNAQGQYTFANLPEGSYSLTASAANYAGQTQSVVLLPGGASTANFSLAPNPGGITGTVTDAATNLAISGATVSYSGGSTTSNSSGQYALSGVAEGSYTVTVSATGYAGQSQTVSVAPGTTSSQNFVLAPNPGSLSGTITDNVTHQPVGGAAVSYSGGSTATDSGGHFAFASVAEGSYSLSVSAGGYATQSQAVTVPAGSAVTVNVALNPNPATISGTVTDSQTNQPISGATVTYSGGSATTNSSGQYSLTGVTEGTYSVTATAAGYGTQNQTVTVGPGGTATANFALVLNPGTISGTVTDASTGNPIAGATVSYSRGSATTDATGHYSLVNVPAGSYTLSASATGYSPVSQSVSVGAGAAVTQNLALSPLPGTLSGTVTDSVTSQPIPGATVTYSGGSTTTNAQGQYSLTNVTEGSYTLSATAPNYAGKSASVSVGPGAALSQNFALAPNPGSISGTVTDAGTTQPLSGAAVSYAGGSATTNAQGQFTLSGVTEGTYVVTVTAAGYVSQNQTVTVGPGAAVTQNFSLTINSGSIIGTVTDSVTNQPIQGASVTITGGATTTTDVSGHYSLAGVTAGTYTVTASATNYTAQSQGVTVTAGTSTTQNFALTPKPGTINGTITDASTNLPIAGATVSYSGGSATTNIQGQYTLTGVVEGSYSLTASAPGYASASKSVTVGPAGTITQNVALAPLPGSVSGTVTDRVSKQPLNGATVTYSGGSTSTNAQGQYTFANVAEGSYTVTASASNYASLSQSVTVGAGATVTLNAPLAPNPGSISGIVLDAGTNLPISGATVSYSGGSATTNASGQYTLSPVTEGSYTVTASAAGYGSKSATVSVGPGGAVSQNFALSQAPGNISGTVTSASTGLAVSGASVTYSGGATTTNASGQYTLSNVPVGSTTVTVSAGGYATQNRTVAVTSNATTTQNFALALAPIFSDGFESGSLSKWSGSIGLTAETATVHSGTYAAEGNTTNGQTHTFKLLGASYSNLYYRMYFDVKSQGGSFTLMGVQASSVSSILHLQLASGGKLQLVNDIAQGSVLGPSITFNTWHSLEVHVIINGTASTIEVWLDGVAVSNFASTSANLGTAAADEVRLGNLATGSTYDVVFDDVAVDTVRVAG